MKNKRILFGICGSFCNHAEVLIELESLCKENDVQAVFMAEPIADIIAVCRTLTLFVINFKKLLKQMRARKSSKA